MLSSKKVLTCAVPPALAWTLLVRRSIKAWGALASDGESASPCFVKEALQNCRDLDDFLCDLSNTMMVWFFQRRDVFLSQDTLTKWSRERFDDYILLPATPGFVNRRDCFFVSHFWCRADNPDPDGEHLRLLQADLQHFEWSYVWVDWTCIPQSPRQKTEEAYFMRSLETMSGLIRNCGFACHYPPHEARLWILYEVAEYTLSAFNGFETCEGFVDVSKFVNHIQEMVEVGVHRTLAKHRYRCTHDRDKAYLASWLEILVLLKRLRVDIMDVRRLLDRLTWDLMSKSTYQVIPGGFLHVKKYEGILICNGQTYLFTPFPKRVSLSATIGLMH